MQNKVILKMRALRRAPEEMTASRQYLLRQQAMMLFRHSPTGITAAFLVALTQTAVLWNYVPSPLLLYWFGAVLVSSALRLGIWSAFRSAAHREIPPLTWIRRMTLGNVLSGMAWGSSILLYDFNWPVAQQILVVLAVAGVTAGAISAYAVVYSAFLAIHIPATLPVIIFFLSTANAAFQALGAILMVYAIGLTIIGYTHHAALRRSLVLDSDNHHLVDKLTESNSQLEQVLKHKQNVMEALRDEKERIQVTLHAIADGVITTGKNGGVVYLNTVAEQLTGWTRDEAHGMPVDEVFEIEEAGTSFPIPADRRHKGASSLSEVIANQRLIRRDGSCFYIGSKTSPIFAADGSSLGTVTVFHDVTLQHQLAERLSYQASHDALTGLLNRAEFEQRVESALQQARQSGISHVACFLDLDQFKVVNDTCGHVAGDELLQRLARGLPALLRESDVFSRLGGDEFGILLRTSTLEQAQGLAERVRAYIKDYHFVWDGKLFEIGVSIGLAEITEDRDSVASVLSAADIACYAAKELGRNQVHVYRESDQQTGRRHNEMYLVSQISQAIELDHLELHFQKIAPTDDISSHALHGEILVRMRDSDNKLVPPGMFLPAAERYNLMPSIDLWVVRNALAWYAAHQCSSDETDHTLLSINLSGASIGHENFQKKIKSLIEQYKIKPGIVCFEITETAAISDLESAVKFMQGLRSIGVKFALDDFGSGLSSFAYLKNLPVDYLKIDGSFVRDIAVDPIDREMVNSIHQLGRVMGISTVAEFVENDAILAELLQIGVDFVQGYGIDRPKPLTEIRPDAKVELVHSTAVVD